eukprot:2389838-Pyramimonas_sp.AAC.1
MAQYSPQRGLEKSCNPLWMGWWGYAKRPELMISAMAKRIQFHSIDRRSVRWLRSGSTRLRICPRAAANRPRKPKC